MLDTNTALFAITKKWGNSKSFLIFFAFRSTKNSKNHIAIFCTFALPKKIEMEIVKTNIEGLLILKPTIFADDRGYFYESYNENRFREIGIDIPFVQDNQSCSRKGVIRGLHFQRPPFAQDKLVRVVRGSVIDVAVDLRKNSPTYGKHHSVVLTGDNHWQFFIPKGFAHGFVALEDDTIFAYKCSNFYHKDSEGTIRYDDPDLQIDWQTENPIVNEKDLLSENFITFKTMF